MIAPITPMPTSLNDDDDDDDDDDDELEEEEEEEWRYWFVLLLSYESYLAELVSSSNWLYWLGM